MAIGIRVNTIQTVFQILDNKKPTSVLLKDFQQKFYTSFLEQNKTIDFIFEKFALYDFAQKIFPDEAETSSFISELSDHQIQELYRQLESIYSDFTEEEQREWSKIKKKEIFPLIDKMFEYFSSVAHKTPVQLHNENFNKSLEEITKSNPMLKMLAPAFAKAFLLPFRLNSSEDALITTLAILRYKADKGQLPENLPQLVDSGYIKELPMDSYSGKPLVYNRIDDNFTLYSFGADFDDDGGTPGEWGEGPQGGDQVFWPVQKMNQEETKKGSGAKAIEN